MGNEFWWVTMNISNDQLNMLFWSHLGVSTRAGRLIKFLLIDNRERLPIYCWLVVTFFGDFCRHKIIVKKWCFFSSTIKPFIIQSFQGFTTRFAITGQNYWVNGSFSKKKTKKTTKYSCNVFRCFVRCKLQQHSLRCVNQFSTALVKTIREMLCTLSCASFCRQTRDNGAINSTPSK